MGETPASTYTATYGHFPLTYSGLSPYFYSGLHPYSGLGWPYTYPLVTVAKPAEEEAAVEAARKKRSADPEAEPEAEADPQLLLTSGLTGLHGLRTPYTYPLTYSSPLAYSAITPIHRPITYTYPLGTSYGYHLG